MNDNLTIALQAIITAGWGNRSHGSVNDGAHYATVDTITEREMLAEILEDLDYDGAPTIADVPEAWWVVTEYDDGTADVTWFPTEYAALRYFRAISGYDGS